MNFSRDLAADAVRLVTSPVVGAVRSATSRCVSPLDAAWELASAPAGEQPADNAFEAVGNCMTVAGALRRLGRWDLDSPDAHLDDHDHWFRHPVALAPVEPGERILLELDGIATIAEVLWNGTHVAESANMFRSLRIDVTDNAGANNVVEVRCASLAAHLRGIRPPRARWKTRLVEDQRLRAIRTTLLGRMPAWTPPVVVVGPYRGGRVVRETGVGVSSVQLSWHGDRLRIDGTVDHGTVTSGSFSVGPIVVQLTIFDNRFSAEADVSTLERWWPHTHGFPARHRVALTFKGGLVEQEPACIELGSTGIRTITVDNGADGAGFTVRVNGTELFCRGGALMPLDVATLEDEPDALRRTLELLRRAGVNMVRVSGTTRPAPPQLFDLCDELGILVWHDLPFANFDYPADAAFLAEVEAETAEFLDRTALSPSLGVVCGGSEVEQQAAMMGVPTAVATAAPLATRLRKIVTGRRPDIAFVASSPTGGSQPFHHDSGVSHYFGVGAYRRPLADARHAGVRFAAECLAFANVPSTQMVRALLGEGECAPTHPRWKQRVPRDRGTGWDFDDVRDHYARELFGVDPLELRWTDPERYLAVGRATSAEVMARVFAEWRRPTSSCAGALVWFLNDLWPGAGWGVIDSTGAAKAALHGMASVLAPFALLAIDEGLNGLDLWACNDGGSSRPVTVEVQALADGRNCVASGSMDIEVPARSAVRVRVDDVFGRFIDPTRAHRFGPPAHDVIVARAVDTDGVAIAHTSYVPPGVVLGQHRNIGLRASVVSWSPQAVEVELTAERFARFATIDAGAATVWPDMVHVAPGHPRTVTIEVAGATTLPPRAFVSALNAAGECEFSLSEPAPCR